MKLAFIKNQYVIASFLQQGTFMPKILIERARIIADGNANFCVPEYVQKLFFMLGMNNDCTVLCFDSMYQNYPIFCVLELDKPKGK